MECPERGFRSLIRSANRKLKAKELGQWFGKVIRTRPGEKVAVSVKMTSGYSIEVNEREWRGNVKGGRFTLIGYLWLCFNGQASGTPANIAGKLNKLLDTRDPPAARMKLLMQEANHRGIISGTDVSGMQFALKEKLEKCLISPRLEELVCLAGKHKKNEGQPIHEFMKVDFK